MGADARNSGSGAYVMHQSFYCPLPGGAGGVAPTGGSGAEAGVSPCKVGSELKLEGFGDGKAPPAPNIAGREGAICFSKGDVTAKLTSAAPPPSTSWAV